MPRLIAALTVLLAVLYCPPSTAHGVAVPADLQAELLAKLAAYDRNFAVRAGETAHIIIAVKAEDAKSSLFASNLKAALARLDHIGGLPHRESVVEYGGAINLAKLVRTKRAAAVYIMPGLESEVEALRAALVGIDVLSLGAAPEYVPKGMVLGFDLISGKPKILINLVQARKQNVNFKADVLKLMKVYQ